jgi:hypothetical protein
MAKEKLQENNKLVKDREFENLGSFPTGQNISEKIKQRK